MSLRERLNNVMSFGKVSNQRNHYDYTTPCSQKSENASFTPTRPPPPELQSHIHLTTRYTIEELLGQGAFATVYSGRRRQSSRRRRNCGLSPKFTSSHRNHSKKDLNDGMNQLVSLKVVNISKVAERKKRQRQNLNITLEEIDSKHQQRKSIPNAKTTNSLDHCSDEGFDDNEDDTNQLFFPSRILHREGDKKCDNDDEENQVMDIIQREVDVHLSASSHGHVNIVQMMEFFQYTCYNPLSHRNDGEWRGGRKKAENDTVVTMVIEYCPWGDLHSYLKRRRVKRRQIMVELDEHDQFDEVEHHDHHTAQHLISTTLVSEEEASHVMKHVLRGLAFLHSRGIIHRDIKAGNILLCPNIRTTPDEEHQRNTQESCSKDENDISLLDCTLKIGDFGLAVQMSEEDDWDDSQHSLCGTPSCIAPEVALSSSNRKNDRKKSMKKKREKKRSMQYDEMDEGTQSSMEYSTGRDSLAACIIRKDQDSNASECDSLLDHARNEDNRGHGQPADLWSTGCLLYVMLIGQYPFSRPKHMYQRMQPNDSKKSPTMVEVQYCKASRVRDTLTRIIQGDWCIPSEVILTKYAKQLLCQLLSLEPEKRGFARGILYHHPFINQFNYRRRDDSTLDIPRIVTTKMLLGDKENQVSTIPTQGNQNEIVDRKQTERKVKKQQSVHKAKAELPPRCTSRSVMSSMSLHRKSKSSKKFVNTIDGINRLPIMKHKWQEDYVKKDAVAGKNQNTKRYYTVYSLPNEIGLVITCERKDGVGAWLHLRQGQIAIAKMSKGRKKSLPDSFHPASYGLAQQNSGSNECDHTIVQEAFHRGPQHCRQMLDISGATSSTDSPCTNGPKHIEHQSMYTASAGLNTTLCSSSLSSNSIFSSRSLPTNRNFPRNISSKKKYKDLSVLLIGKNRPFLSLYRKLEMIVNQIKMRMPKIILHIYSHNMVAISKRNSVRPTHQIGKQLCKAMLMENEPKPIVEMVYADGLHIKYDTATGLAIVSMKDSKIGTNGTIRVCMKRNTLIYPPTDGRHIDFKNDQIKIFKTYTFHIKMARVIIQKCLEIDESYKSKFLQLQDDANDHKNDLFPIVKNVVAAGKSCNEWIDVTGCVHE